MGAFIVLRVAFSSQAHPLACFRSRRHERRSRTGSISSFRRSRQIILITRERLNVKQQISIGVLLYLILTRRRSSARGF
jgi:hypothetical protein